MSTPATPAKTYKFQCKQCKFNISRTEKDLNNDCPKCLIKNPYVAPTQALKNEEHKKLMSPSSKAVRTSTAVCPSAPNGEVHTFQLGSCKFCKKSEGSIEDKPRTVGATAYVGGKADCSSGGKHMFSFSKCTKCGMSELEYTKQKNPSTPTRTATTVRPNTTTPTATAKPVTSSTTPAKPTTTSTVASPRVTTASARPAASATTAPATPTRTAVRPTAAATPTRAAATTPTRTAAAATARPAAATTTAPKAAPTTPSAKPVTALAPSTPAKTYKFQCKQCKFNISRTEKDLNNDCPKCLIKNPYVAPTQALKNEEHKKLMSPSSKAVRTSTAVCPSAPNGEVHTFQLGSCKFCKKSEGSIEDKPRTVGATAYVGGKADCSSGGKHMFSFSKCTKCGMSELEYTKQKKAATVAK